MATAGCWAEPKVVREQIVLFASSLDERLVDVEAQFEKNMTDPESRVNCELRSFLIVRPR